MSALTELLAKQASARAKATGTSPASATKVSTNQTVAKPIQAPVQSPITGPANPRAIPDAAPSHSGSTYFHASIANFKFYVKNGKFGYFKNHWCITDDPEVIKTVQEGLLESVNPTAVIKIKEVSAAFYMASQTIQLEIEPLPEQPS